MYTKKKITILISLSLLLLSALFFRQFEKSDFSEVLDSKITNTPPSAQKFTPSEMPLSDNPLPSQDGSLFTVEKVIDGDTISVSKNGVKETIRLIGINTPETVDPRRPIECFGIEASRTAKDLLSGKKVYLEEDKTQGSRDKYNRLLRYVRRSDGLFFNLWMIQNGYAYEYTYASEYKYTSQFKTAQAEAQAQKKGLWGASLCKEAVSLESGINNTSPNTPQGVGDKDCKDFTSQSKAQDFFKSLGGPGSDPHKLDTDGDGVVCESLP